MGTVEAAASLFYLEEVSSDPFASLGAAPTAPASNEDSFFGAPVSELEDATANRAALDSELKYDASTNLAAGKLTQEGSYEGQMHSQAYGPSIPLGTNAPSAYQQAPYNAYAASVYIPSQPPPPTTSTYSSLRQGLSVSAQGTPHYAHVGAESSVSPPSTRLGATTVTVPAPPSTVAAVNRPKIANAYDPPFPAPGKHGKRGTRNVSSVQTYTYGLQNPPLIAKRFSTPPASHVASFPSSMARPTVQPSSHLPSQSAQSGLFPGHAHGSHGAVEGNHTHNSYVNDYGGISSGNQVTHRLPGDSQTPRLSLDDHPRQLTGHTSNPLPEHIVTVPAQSKNLDPHQQSDSLEVSFSSDTPISMTSPLAKFPEVVTTSCIQRDQWSALSGNSVSSAHAAAHVFESNMAGEVEGYTPLNMLPLSHAHTSPSLAYKNGKSNSHIGQQAYPILDTGANIGSSTPSLNAGFNTETDFFTAKTHVNGHLVEQSTPPSLYPVRSSMDGLALKYGQPSYSQSIYKTERNRSMSNCSMLSSASQDGFYSAPAKVMNYGLNDQTQELLTKPVHNSYAPSPSLVGANDPLGRTANHVPVLSFGFGGKVVTCFHGTHSLSTGFDVALAARNSAGIHIRALRHIVPDSTDSRAASFPGPLFSEPGNQTSLVRTGPNSQTKTKKARVLQYLSERTDELGLSLRYLRPNSLEIGRAEGKIVLMKILRLMVEHDGRLTGTPELDTAVRLALVPKLEGTLMPDAMSSGFAAPADSASLPPVDQADDEVISATSLRASHLQKIQDFLLRGQRKQAYHYALDEKLWAHAMVISSSVDKEAWKEVVNEFLRSEIGTPDHISSSSIQPSSSINQWEGLRVAYSLFSGQGASAVQEFFPRNLLSKTTRLQPLHSHPTPRTPNFSTPAQPPLIPFDVLKQWPETVAMMLPGSMSQETSTALTSLGDHLATNQFIEAAHVCYLIAPQASSLGGVGHPSARMVLVGSRNPQSCPNFSKDLDPIIFSEIVEFALSLTLPVKGQEPFTGIPHLQAYRLIRAMSLAEVGDMQQANRYCEAITTALNRSSPYVTPTLLEQLQGLSDRIAGVIQPDKSFWTGAKISKPSLDTIGGWLEGRFTKLVTGDELDKSEDTSKPDNGEFSGPFSHYSTISSTTPSARSSPQPSAMNYHNSLPPRTGSAMASSSPYQLPQIGRASSAMDHVRRKPSPVPTPRVASANASVTAFSSSSDHMFDPQPVVHMGYPGENPVTPRPSSTPDSGISSTQETGWWSSSGYDENAGRTPTAATFIRVDDNTMSESSDGFISLMGNAPYSVAPAETSTSILQDNELEDLGFGNSKPKPEPAADPSPSQPSSVATDLSQKAETLDVPASSGGWFSRWWKKSDGPIKANLGEQSDFYFDKDLGKWVNRKAAESPPKPAPPPPPPRAQTASPGMTGPRSLAPESSSPPPARSASAIDLSTSPPSRTIMRVRSNLVPADSAPSSPSGTKSPEGPPPRTSQSTKRNARNRYVNVLQESSGAM